MPFVEIEQGTTGVASKFGAITSSIKTRPSLPYGGLGKRSNILLIHRPRFLIQHRFWLAQLQENVPLKRIEFFIKFRIVEPIAFVRNIGASNFDIVLSSAVQDAIRNRSRKVETARAYDLRGSDVGDMQETLNRQMQMYGVRITGANIPDVQLPTQYQDNLSMRERVSKELIAYEKEWELIRKRRNDALLLQH